MLNVKYFIKIQQDVLSLANLQRNITNIKCKKVNTNRMITMWKEQKIYIKERRKSYKIVLKIFPMYKLKIVIKI